MYETIGNYCFDLDKDCYINDRGEKLDIVYDDKWYAIFENGVILEEETEKELIKKVEKFVENDK
jgi:hypothetical protein